MCLFKWFTGLPCPGCGMTRAYVQLFSGHLEEAFYYHPLFWLVPLVCGLVFWHRQPLLAKLYASKIFWRLIFVLVIGVYVYRLGQFFPDQAPLDFDAEALVPTFLARFF